jgi:endoglucanase
MFNDQPFQLKGMNWFGYETDCRIVHGLWQTPIDDLFQFMAENHYNALRIPLSFEIMNTGFHEYPQADCCQANRWIVENQMTVKDTLHMMFQKAARRGMVILLDFHTINHMITPKPYTNDVSILDVQEVWISTIKEFLHYENFMGIDIKNEPHEISWKEWGSFVVGFVEAVNRRVSDFRGLFIVEGIQDLNDQSVWGGSFSNIDQPTIDYIYGKGKNKIVLSPHVYGVSVRGPVAQYDNENTFQTWFGWLTSTTILKESAVAIGEVGGFFVTEDMEWHWKLLDYLKKSTKITDAFYWCLNPDSGDTQGVLYDDWMTPNPIKLDFHQQLQPNPTLLSFSNLTLTH